MKAHVATALATAAGALILGMFVSGSVKAEPSPCKGLEQPACNGLCRWSAPLSGTVQVNGKDVAIQRKGFCALNTFAALSQLRKQQQPATQTAARPN